MRRTIVNDPEDLVPEALEGLVLSHPLMLELEAEHRFVTRRQRATDKVGLVSGGGSGHEPLHAGFVGTGMLDVAVAGAVFASPTALQVLEATKAADSGRGVVQIVKNYTGDVLN
ncbi:MAG: dihydroxyacetone kinase subunit DhaK, partial [Brachybacterium sp.]